LDRESVVHPKNVIHFGSILGRQVAIKRARTPASHITQETRFLLQYPNIPRTPRLLAYGEYKQATAFIMEPAGYDPNDIYPVEDVKYIILQLAETIQAVHALGFVHDGVRRDNVIRFGHDFYLIDFERCRTIGEDIRFSHVRAHYFSHLRGAYANTSEDWIPLMYLAHDLLNGDVCWANALKDKNTLAADPKTLFPAPEHLDFLVTYEYMLKNHTKLDGKKIIDMLNGQHDQAGYSDHCTSRL
jgi:predicted Ser/Thr protein kinase